jgi:hypothetical protein
VNKVPQERIGKSLVIEQLLESVKTLVSTGVLVQCLGHSWVSVSVVVVDPERFGARPNAAR